MMGRDTKIISITPEGVTTSKIPPVVEPITKEITQLSSTPTLEVEDLPPTTNVISITTTPTKVTSKTVTDSTTINPSTSRWSDPQIEEVTSNPREEVGLTTITEIAITRVIIKQIRLQDGMISHHLRSTMTITTLSNTATTTPQTSTRDLGVLTSPTTDKTPTTKILKDFKTGEAKETTEVRRMVSLIIIEEEEMECHEEVALKLAAEETSMATEEVEALSGKGLLRETTDPMATIPEGVDNKGVEEEHMLFKSSLMRNMTETAKLKCARLLSNNSKRRIMIQS